MKGEIVLTNGKIVTSKGIIDKGYILIRHGYIEKIDEGDFLDYQSTSTIIDVKSNTVLPGFIDQHMHGFAGYNIMDCSYDELSQILISVLKYGVTGLCPTTLSDDPHNFLFVLSKLAKIISTNNIPGAKVLGINIEGPFMNPAAKGAHSPLHMVPPSIDQLLRYWEASEGNIKVITIAPELPNALAVIEKATDMGITVSIGHTCANFEQTVDGIKAGAKCITHFYNAMPKFHHREPGPIGAALLSDGVMLELIADGKMVNPAAIMIAVKFASLGRIIMITDAMPPTGGTDIKRFNLCGNEVLVKDGACYLPDGTMWGSVLTMNRALDNLVHWINEPLYKLVKTTSYNPSRLIGLFQKGKLDKGYIADVIVVNDRNEVIVTIVEGEIFYRKPDGI